MEDMSFYPATDVTGNVVPPQNQVPYAEQVTEHDLATSALTPEAENIPTPVEENAQSDERLAIAPTYGLYGDVLSVVGTARGELRRTGLLGKLGLAGFVAAEAVHQVATEGAMLSLGMHDMAATNSPIITAAINGGVSTGAEMLLAAGAAGVLKVFSKTTAAVADRFLLPGDESKRRRFLDSADKVGTMAMFGAGATVVLDSVKHPEEPVAKHRRAGFKAAGWLGALNFGYALAFGGGIWGSEEAGTNVAFNTLEQVANSPYTYATIATAFVGRMAFAVRSHSKKRAALRAERLAERAAEQGPQYEGIISESDRSRAVADPETLMADNGAILLTPVVNNGEVNQAFFEGQQAYYLNWPGIVDQSETVSNVVAQKIASLPAGTKIMVDHRVGEEHSPVDYLQAIAGTAGRTLEVDRSAIDSKTGVTAGVHHFYSRANVNPEIQRTAGTMREAQQMLVDSGEWDKLEEKNVFYVHGPELTDELCAELWDVYDKTFDELTASHPSAQKQISEEFWRQSKLPESHITYVRDADNKIVNALFALEDASKCTWINADFYAGLNPDGKTMFVPGVATRLNAKGAQYSALTMRAMSKIGSLTDGITGFATQCTDRSAKYIPVLTERATVGTANLALEEVASYEYPVFVVR